MSREQLNDSDEIQWPVPPPDQALIVPTMQSLLFKTRGLFINEYERLKTNIQDAQPDDVILQLDDNLPGSTPALVLRHGLQLPPKYKPLFLRQPNESLYVLNSLKPEERIFIARTLVWEYVMTMLEEREPLNDDDFFDEDDDEEEIFDTGRSNAWEESQQASEEMMTTGTVDLQIAMDSADEERNIRAVYEAIIRGKLSEEHVSLRAA